MRTLFIFLVVGLQSAPPETLPPPAAAKLRASLKAAAAHQKHVWRDTAPFNGELLTGYIEIPRGGKQKFELDMAKNAPAVDRVIPDKIGGYPINYGIVPQTVSYDGDPFDVLVLGPPLKTGAIVHGVIVGLMHMTDEKGLDSKVVVSLVGKDGKPLHQLTDADRERVADYFNRYKRDDDDPKTFATVPGWGTAADGLAFVRRTHQFFRQGLSESARRPKAVFH
jgi:inorganic pyrophosphatase